MVGLNSMNSIPNWLQILTEEKFFTPCTIHDSVKKNEKNVFCVDCCTSICPRCVPIHHSHFLLQIRRYMYSDVIRLGDAHKWMNCSLVQPYRTNRAKVVFLKQRPTCRPVRGCGKFCITCERSLQDPYLFCSLSCKVHHLVIITKRASTKDYEISVVAANDSTRWCSTSGSSGAPEFVKKKRSSLQLLNRRKGVPLRSPLY